MAAWMPANASEPIAIITAVASPMTSISIDTLKLIYLRKTQIDEGGNLWIPLNLPANDPLRRTFSLDLFSALPEDQENYWNVQYFNGIMPPKVMASEEAVLRFIAATPGAIGYVHKHNADERVKVLLHLTQ